MTGETSSIAVNIIAISLEGTKDSGVAHIFYPSQNGESGEVNGGAQSITQIIVETENCRITEIDVDKQRTETISLKDRRVIDIKSTNKSEHES